MSGAAELTDLIARLERATGPDRELDARLAVVRDPKKWRLGHESGPYCYERGWIIADGHAYPVFTHKRRDPLDVDRSTFR